MKEKLIYIFMILNLLDIGGGIGIKYISFLFLLIYVLLRMENLKIDINDIILFIYMPFFSLIYSIYFSNINITSVISAITYNFTIVIGIYLLNEELNMDIVLYNILKIMNFFSIIVILMYMIFEALLKMHKESIGIIVGNWMMGKRMGYIGYNYFAGKLLPNVYFGWSMFLIFALALAFYYKKKLYILNILLANILTLSSANILFSIVICMYFFVSGNIKKYKKLVIISISIIWVGVILYSKGAIILSYLNDFIDDVTLKSDGSSVKIGHIISVIDYMFNDIRYFFFGMGAGSEFYSIGTDRLQSSMEVSQIEFWRRYGSIYFCLFMGYIFYEIYKLLKLKGSKKIIGMGLGVLFVATSTNPQLMSPLFLTILFISKSWGKYQIKEKKYEKSSSSSYI